jgi:hypothetical protein
VINNCVADIEMAPKRNIDWLYSWFTGFDGWLLFSRVAVGSVIMYLLKVMKEK